MPFPTAPRAASTTSSNPAPERSPLEPLSTYSRRLKKWRMDNSKWEGQRRAVRSLDEKKTELPKQLP